MVSSCWAMTDNTSMSIRLNSSKQHQAPDCASPEKKRPIICEEYHMNTSTIHLQVWQMLNIPRATVFWFIECRCIVHTHMTFMLHKNAGMKTVPYLEVQAFWAVKYNTLLCETLGKILTNQKHTAEYKSHYWMGSESLSSSRKSYRKTFFRPRMVPAREVLRPQDLLDRFLVLPSQYLLKFCDCMVGRWCPVQLSPSYTPKNLLLVRS